MSNLWVYGDSYAVNIQSAEWQWYKQYAKAKKLDCYVKADFGVANEWICMNFYEDFGQNKIQNGDTVIIVSTACVRHWFLWDHPNVSNYENMRNLPFDYFGISDDQKKAIEMYYKHIQSGFVDSWKYDATMAWLNHYVTRLKKERDITIIPIQGFQNATDIHPCGLVSGDLFTTVCTEEFKSQKAMDEYYQLPIPDQRVNHMLKDNHTILANALLEGKPFNTKDLNWNKGLLSTSTSAMLKDQLSPEPLR